MNGAADGHPLVRPPSADEPAAAAVAALRKLRFLWSARLIRRLVRSSEMSAELRNCPIAKVDFEEAKTLADLAALTQDLGAVMLTCTRLMDLIEEKSKDQILVEALWTSALVRYSRCFANGKRFGLEESLFSGLNGDPIAVHRYFMAMRNKHIAHSVNPFEQMEVGLVLEPQDRGERKVIGVSTLAIRHITSDREGVRQLGMLAKVLLAKVTGMAKQLEQEVLAIGRTLRLDDLYSRATPRVVAPGPDAATKSRQ
jgi:hypothetical protein